MEHQLKASRACTALALAALAASACTQDASDVITATPQFDIVSAVTPSLAATLTSQGTFPGEMATGEGGRAVITPARAKELALAHMRLFGPYVRDFVERGRGRPVNFATLTAESRVLVAESPYEALPTIASTPHHKAFGPYYLVTLASAEGPVVNVAVSAYATDVNFVNGLFSADGPYGNEFRIWPVAKSGDFGPRYTPEEAVRIASVAFGQPLQEAPRFIRAGYDYAPQLGRWRLRLARPTQVMLRDGGTNLTTDVIYLDRDGTFSVSASTPGFGRLQFRSEFTHQKVQVQVAVKRGFSTNFRALAAR